MTTDKSSWRLIVDTPASGAWNMAADEAILEQIGRGESLPTLRLYAWDPPCLSLGYAQPFSDVDTTRLHTHGWDVVRRPTGGRAILHTDELTYSVIAPLNEPLIGGTVLESYNRLATALLAAVKSLNVPVEMKEHQPGLNTNAMGPVCFEAPSTYEIMVEGKKLIGSAQARRKEGVLQHGTLPLFGDLTRITETLVFPDETTRAAAAQKLLSRATTIETALGKVVEWKTAAQAFVYAFESELNLDFKHEELSPSENDRAKQLLSEKYNNPEWTERT
jgi:lipoyl(octanoyl) transferase